ncbi:hypothetical protein FIBSPDRAFT_890335 [Athelia psychrophila]|uniref:Uncharacterized protein n=1 Tax=Athelia psychrophila TaxID=1759441 RepID=A0A166L0L5_9AGAM|nr:hypothetical protein FIBSPDRAFT_890335 [Fibularhizoctonia sp. CBS 109695]
MPPVNGIMGCHSSGVYTAPAFAHFVLSDAAVPIASSWRRRARFVIAAYEVLVVGRTTRLNVPLLESPTSDTSSAPPSPISVSSPQCCPSSPRQAELLVAREHRKSPLVFFRVHAVLAHSPTTQALFCLLPHVITASPALQVYSIGELPLLWIFVSKRVYRYGNATCTFRGTVFSASLFRLSRVRLRSGLLDYCLTISFHIACTTHACLGLPYAEFVGLSSTRACRVFRMMLLCEMDDVGLVTLSMGAGAAGGMTMASVQYARRSFGEGEEEDEEEDDGEDGEMGSGIRPLRTVRRVVRCWCCRFWYYSAHAKARAHHGSRAMRDSAFGLAFCFNSAWTAPRYRSFGIRFSESPWTSILP